MFGKIKILLVVLLSITAMHQSAQAITLPQLPAPIPPASATTTLVPGQVVSCSGTVGSVQYFRMAVTTGFYTLNADLVGPNAGNGRATFEKLACSPAGFFSASTDSSEHSMAMFNSAGYYYFMVRGKTEFSGKLKVTFNGLG